MLAVADKYLHYYGHSLTSFRHLAGLPQEETQVTERDLRTMAWPRCGVSDAMMMSEEARWRKKSMTWWVETYVNGIPSAEQDAILAAAWQSWMDVADLKMVRVTDRGLADIIISTGRGANQGFDGPQGTLAWAQLPPGDDRQLLMRFDIDEHWLAQVASPGIVLLNVAAHEFGHLLGLDHSRKQGALMAPFYSPSVSRPQEADDVSRIQSLYGPPVAVPPSLPPTGPPQGKKWILLEADGQVSGARVLSVV